MQFSLSLGTQIINSFPDGFFNCLVFFFFSYFRSLTRSRRFKPRALLCRKIVKLLTILMYKSLCFSFSIELPASLPIMSDPTKYCNFLRDVEEDEKNLCKKEGWKYIRQHVFILSFRYTNALQFQFP